MLLKGLEPELGANYSAREHSQGWSASSYLRPSVHGTLELQFVDHYPENFAASALTESDPSEQLRDDLIGDSSSHGRTKRSKVLRSSTQFAAKRS